MMRLANTFLRRQVTFRNSLGSLPPGLRCITEEIKEKDIPRPNRNVRLDPPSGTFNSRELAEIYAREYKESSSSEEIVAVERSQSETIRKLRKSDKSGEKASISDDPENILNAVYPEDLANVTKKMMGRKPDDDGRMTKDRRV